MLTRYRKNYIAAWHIGRGYEPSDLADREVLTDSEIAKAAAAMTRLRRSRQLTGRRDRQVWRILARQRNQPPPRPLLFPKGSARAAGTGHSVLLFADRPGHGLGLWLMRGTLVISAPRMSHWYGGLGR
jgi:hypothetical protein